MKYQKFSWLSMKDIGNLEFVAKTQFLGPLYPETGSQNVADYPDPKLCSLKNDFWIHKGGGGMQKININCKVFSSTFNWFLIFD